MCKAREISNHISLLLSEAINERKSLINKISELDKKLSDIYHDLEKVRVNAVQGYKVTKYIQEIVTERRNIKSELHSLESLINGVDANNLKQKFESAAKRAESVYINETVNKAKIRGVLQHII